MSYRRWTPPVAWAAIILTITSIPGSNLGAVAPYVFPGADKLAHVGMYGVLGWLAARANGLGAGAAPGARGLAPVLMMVFAFAALDEWHQAFIPGRSADALDWLADVVGATTGALVFASRRTEAAS
ncbi:MAG: VanZ family protein [Gemmatimonadota bacterium]|nr:VanZ family protein [Gemmatimonadota bacterium]